MALLSYVSAAFVLAHLTTAFTAFQPNCTIPPEVVNYSTSPPVRGTLGIFWSCFSVILLCTWSIQHLAVPVHHDSRILSRFNGFVDECRWNYTKLKWMALSLLMPEFILGKALTEHLAAGDSQKKFNSQQWTTMHAFFANMRGFVLRFDTTAVRMPLVPSNPTDDGRALSKPRPGGIPTPYFEQDARKAERIELNHCRKTCGKDCPYRMEQSAFEEKGSTYNFPSSPQATVTERPVRDENYESAQDPEQNLSVTTDAETHHVNTANGEAQLAEFSPIPASGITLVDSPDMTRERMGEDFLVSRTPAPTANSQRTLPSPAHDRSSKNRLSSPRGPQQQRPRSASQQAEPQNTKSMPAIPDAEGPPGLLPHEAWQGTWALSALQLRHAYEEGIIGSPPYITAEELKDQSKGDALVKGLAVLQITWLVIQIIVRAFQNLAITLLEVTVLAFAACAIITYILLWHKPQDVKVPTYIDAVRPITREDVIQLAARAPVSTLMVHEFWHHGVAVRAMADNVFPWTPGLKTPMPTMTLKPFRLTFHRVYLNPVFVGIGLSSVLFGSIHFAAWNFTFPTPVERLLWRITCGILVGLPLLGTSVYCGFQHVSKQEGRGDSRVNQLLRRGGHVCVPIYLLARMFLIVEVFRGLAYSPPSAFQEANWPSAIPHYG